MLQTANKFYFKFVFLKLRKNVFKITSVVDPDSYPNPDSITF
jgi:hypothetical protein